MKELNTNNVKLKNHLFGFLELNKEYDLNVKIEGNLPDDLDGEFIQIGPRGGKINGEIVHWFDSNGMMSVWKIKNGKAVFKNRFIITEQIRKEQQAKKRKYRGYFTNLKGGWVKNFGKMPKNPVNAWLVDIENGLLASGGYGVPVEIDPVTLKVRKNSPFLNKLPKKWHNWITEPMNHPETGSMLVLTGFFINHQLSPAIELIEIPLNGKPRLITRINLKDIYLTHAFFITKRFAIIPITPYRTGLKGTFKAIVGLQSFTNAMSWHSTEPLSFYIVDLEGKKPLKHIKTSAEYPLHIANAFEQGNDIIVDCEVYDDGTRPLMELEAIRTGKFLQHKSPGGKLIRYSLKTNGTISRKELSEKTVVYPFIDESHAGLRSTPLFGVNNPSWNDSGLICINPDMNEQIKGIESLNFVGGGPVIVNREKSKKSWILCPVFTGGKDTHSELHIYSSENFKLECKLLIPLSIPFSVHCHFRG